jgi:hypothetical protein
LVALELENVNLVSRGMRLSVDRKIHTAIGERDRSKRSHRVCIVDSKLNHLAKKEGNKILSKDAMVLRTNRK